MTDEKKQRLSRIGARLGIAGIALAATLGIAACGSDDDAEGSGGGSIDLVAYSTPQQAFEEGLIPAFQDTDSGSGAFGASTCWRQPTAATRAISPTTPVVVRLIRPEHITAPSHATDGTTLRRRELYFRRGIWSMVLK